MSLRPAMLSARRGNLAEIVAEIGSRPEGFEERHRRSAEQVELDRLRQPDEHGLARELERTKTALKIRAKYGSQAALRRYVFATAAHLAGL